MYLLLRNKLNCTYVLQMPFSFTGHYNMIPEEPEWRISQPKYIESSKDIGDETVSTIKKSLRKLVDTV